MTTASIWQRLVSFAFSLLLISFSADAYGDEPPGSNETSVPLAPPATEPSSTLAPRAQRHGGKIGKEFGEKKKAATNDVLRGHCTLLDSPLNPITGPCISVPLELKDAKGQSMGIARTSSQGDFEFSLEDGAGPFTLSPSSSYYVLVSPTDRVRKGDRVDLKIREKN